MRFHLIFLEIERFLIIDHLAAVVHVAVKRENKPLTGLVINFIFLRREPNKLQINKCHLVSQL